MTVTNNGIQLNAIPIQIGCILRIQMVVFWIPTAIYLTVSDTFKSQASTLTASNGELCAYMYCSTMRAI